jgi:hypothetical protein
VKGLLIAALTAFGALLAAMAKADLEDEQVCRWLARKLAYRPPGDGGRVLHVVGEALAAAGLDRQAVDVSGVERSHPARKTRLGGLQPLRIHSPRWDAGARTDTSGHEGEPGPPNGTNLSGTS